jgi:hypothetical protein
MPKLKVKPLEWYMKKEAENLAKQGYTPLSSDFELIGRDGYYCRGNKVWFEFKGVGYWEYPESGRSNAREDFCYTLTVNDEAILPQREFVAMRQVLKTCRDAGVKKTIRERLYVHEQAVQLRSIRRASRLSRSRPLRTLSPAQFGVDGLSKL